MSALAEALVAAQRRALTALEKQYAAVKLAASAAASNGRTGSAPTVRSNTTISSRAAKAATTRPTTSCRSATTAHAAITARSPILAPFLAARLVPLAVRQGPGFNPEVGF